MVKYHNHRHTNCVVLAAIRLFHGLFHEKKTLSNDIVIQGLLSAYFHDLGMLPQSDSEVINTSYHERRSIAILEKYLKKDLEGRIKDRVRGKGIFHNSAVEFQKKLNTIQIGQEVSLAGYLFAIRGGGFLEFPPGSGIGINVFGYDFSDHIDGMCLVCGIVRPLMENIKVVGKEIRATKIEEDYYDFRQSEFKIRIRLYADWLTILSQAGLRGEFYGDWDFSKYDKEKSTRLIVVARIIER